MAASVHDQAHLTGLFDAGEVNRLFSASAEVRAMMLVEGTLAKVQGSAGVIPEISGAAIHRASLEIQIDPGALTEATAQNGVCVPALVAAFRDEMQAPEHAQYVHWGATSQDIIDTGLMLRLRQACALISTDLVATLNTLGALANRHADTPMAARTYGQHAAPTGFGAVVASWGYPLLDAHTAFAALQFPASLSGAVGTATAIGPKPDDIRAAFAHTLGLTDLARSWHTDRTPVLAIGRACAALCTACEKMGDDIVSMTQSDVGELTLSGTGASSTMPQKQNPVQPSILMAVARTARGLEHGLQASATHRFQRDGAAWFTEWMVLPQIVLAAATAAKTAATLVQCLSPSVPAMRKVLTQDGFLFAEALSFALAEQMPRPDAQAAVKALAAQARDTGKSLQELAENQWPNLADSLFDPDMSLGTAPADARAFASKVSTL